MSYELVGSFRYLLFLFGPLNALLHVYVYYAACFPLVIRIIYLLPVHMVSHHLYCTTTLSIECWNPQQVQLDLMYPLRKKHWV